MIKTWNPKKCKYSYSNNAYYSEYTLSILHGHKFYCYIIICHTNVVRVTIMLLILLIRPTLNIFSHLLIPLAVLISRGCCASCSRVMLLTTTIKVLLSNCRKRYECRHPSLNTSILETARGKFYMYGCSSRSWIVYVVRPMEAQSTLRLTRGPRALKLGVVTCQIMPSYVAEVAT